MNRFARTKLVVLLTGAVMVAMGIAVLVNPIGAVETIVRTMGWILAIYGGITLASAFVKGDPLNNAPSDLVLGGITLVLGLVMGLFPGVLVSFVWTLIGVIVLITGVLDVIEASDFRRARSPLAMPATVSGVITVALGVLVIITPAFSLTMAMVVAAIALLIDGVTEVIFGLGM